MVHQLAPPAHTVFLVHAAEVLTDRFVAQAEHVGDLRAREPFERQKSDLALAWSEPVLAVVIGGLITATILTLGVLPSLGAPVLARRERAVV